MAISSINCYTSSTPAKLYGVIGKDIIICRLWSFTVIRPHCQSIIAIITDRTVINCRIRSTYTEVNTISIVVSYTAVYHLYILRIVYFAIVIAKPETTLKVLFPYIAEHCACSPYIHKALIDSTFVVS